MIKYKLHQKLMSNLKLIKKLNFFNLGTNYIKFG